MDRIHELEENLMLRSNYLRLRAAARGFVLLLAFVMVGCSILSSPCPLSQEVVIQSTDVTEPSVGMDVFLPDGIIVTVGPGSATSAISVPDSGTITLMVVAKDDQGVQDAQIWAGKITSTFDPVTGIATRTGPGLSAVPSASNSDRKSAGEKGCTQRVVSQNIEVRQTPLSAISYEVSGRGVNFSGGVARTTPVVIQVKRIPIINLSYKIFIDPTTGNLPPRNNIVDNIRLAVRQMNVLCYELDTNFRFRLIEEPVLIGGPSATSVVNSWYNTQISGLNLAHLENDAKNNRNDFAWRTNAINIYLTGFGWGGYTGDLVAIAVDADILGVHHQIHEIGHFFHLLHTHDNGGNDGIVDTLPDNPAWNADDLSQTHFHKNYGDLTEGEKTQVDNTWKNIMSYHSSSTNPLRILTKGQLAKWDAVLKNNKSNVAQ